MFQIGCCHRPHPILDQIWSKFGCRCSVFSRGGPAIQQSKFGPTYPIWDQIVVQNRTNIWSKIGPDLVQIRVRPINLVQIKCLPCPCPCPCPCQCQCQCPCPCRWTASEFGPFALRAPEFGPNVRIWTKYHFSDQNIKFWTKSEFGPKYQILDQNVRFGTKFAVPRPNLVQIRVPP